MRDSESEWQCEPMRCAVVLREVFAWLEGQELARAGAVCRSWCRAASDPTLWRRLLLRRTSLFLLPPESISWRQEYVSAHAGWEEVARLPAGAALLHAALAPAGDRLALVSDDASISVWQYTADSTWKPHWSANFRIRGWLSAARVLWAANGDRLLVTGPLALTDSWEIIVLRMDEDKYGRMASSTRCSAGVAGCWVGENGDAFLSFELRVLAPSIACTTVWLNAATQEMQSEYVGVRSVLFRIYNEDRAHITHASVVVVPVEAQTFPSEPSPDPWAKDADDNQEYYRATKSKGAEVSTTVLVTGRGAGEGTGALCTWGLSALFVPPVLASAGGELQERVRRRRERLAMAVEEPGDVEPSEESVRALCTPPDYECRLPTLPIGMVPHQRGRCVWVSTSDDSAWCMSLPTLRPLRVLRAAAAAPDPDQLHYVQPALSDAYFASPQGARSGRVCAWTSKSGARCPSTREPVHTAPALAALLPPMDPPTMLVVAGDAIHVWRSRATSQCSFHELPCVRPTRNRVVKRHTRTEMPLHAALRGFERIAQKLRPGPVVLAKRAAGGSCESRAVPECPPCKPPPRPPCRAKSAEPTHAIRVVCCPPPQGARPPCCGPEPKPALTCNNRKSVGKGVLDHGSTPCRTVYQNTHKGRCGTELDRVARRHALAEETRRRDYEREAALVAVRPAAESSEPYRLGADRECARATDGRQYAIACAAQPAERCGPERVPPPPRCVDLVPDSGCQIRAGPHMDPCAHRPRVLVDIDRSTDSGRAAPDPGVVKAGSHPHKSGSNEGPSGRIPQTPSPARGLKSRLMESLNLGQGGEGATCPRKPCPEKCAENVAHKDGGSERCTTSIPPAPATPPCRNPSLAERIRARNAGPKCTSRGPSCGRKIHTSAAFGANSAQCGSKTTSGGVPQKKSSGDLDGVLRERAQLKEAGRGRVVSVTSGSSSARTSPPAGGGLELRVPPGAERVRVRVSMEGAGRSSHAASCVTAAPLGTSANLDSGVAACRDSASTPGRRDSWLSIKTIQKKLSGCRLGDDSHSSKETKVGAKPPATQKTGDKSPCTPPPKPKPAQAPCAPRPSPSCPKSPPCSRPTPSLPKSPSPGCGGSSPKPQDATKKFSSTLALVTNTIYVNT